LNRHRFQTIFLKEPFLNILNHRTFNTRLMVQIIAKRWVTILHVAYSRIYANDIQLLGMCDDIQLLGMCKSDCINQPIDVL